MKSEVKLALFATLFFGAAGGVFSSTISNYLADVQHLDAGQRGWLEFPRELPGFLIIFVSGALLVFLRETQMAAFAMLFTCIGSLGLAFLPSNVAGLVAFTMIWSLGDHIIFAVESPIALRLARDGAEGKRLGQFGGARNIGTILGVAVVYVLAKLLGDRYSLLYTFASACALTAGVLYWRLRVGREDQRSSRIVLRKKYSLFYLISALFGLHKQIFLVFGGWVLVKKYDVPVSTIALLFFIAATLGVIFRPLMGEIIDWLGERTVLSADEFVLALVCLSYAFASDLVPKPYDVYLLYATYILDSLLYALRVARTTYLKKIAVAPTDITSSAAVGVTIEHALSMSLPVFSGYIWVTWGYRWVFLLAASIAAAGFFVCLRIRVPKSAEPVGPLAPESEEGF